MKPIVGYSEIATLLNFRKGLHFPDISSELVIAFYTSFLKSFSKYFAAFSFALCLFSVLSQHIRS